jgi:hypothetical protein
MPVQKQETAHCPTPIPALPSPRAPVPELTLSQHPKPHHSTPKSKLIPTNTPTIVEQSFRQNAHVPEELSRNVQPNLALPDGPTRAPYRLAPRLWLTPGHFTNTHTQPPKLCTTTMHSILHNIIVLHDTWGTRETQHTLPNTGLRVQRARSRPTHSRIAWASIQALPDTHQ